MALKGHCNCGNVTVTLPEPVEQCMLCYCANCRRAGGPCSANLIVEESKVAIQDPNQSVKKYTDKNTQSGNVITRNFCGVCGSPIFTVSPAAPGTLFLKASLFDRIPAPVGEYFEHEKPSWIGKINAL